MGPDRRSLRKLGEQIGKSYTILGRWSTRDDWTERVSAWDAHMLAISQAALETEVAAMAKRHSQMAVAMLNKVAGLLQELDGKELTPTQAVAWFEAATRIERQSRGMPDLTLETLNITDAEQEGIDPNRLVLLDNWVRARPASGGEEE